jgi:hypothetical protein
MTALSRSQRYLHVRQRMEKMRYFSRKLLLAKLHQKILMAEKCNATLVFTRPYAAILLEEM